MAGNTVKPNRLTDMESFRNIVLNREDPRVYIVDVFSSWCGPCLQLLPLLNSFLSDVEELPSRLSYIEIDSTIIPDHKLAESSLPTFSIFKSGEKLKVVKGVNATEVMDTLKEHLPPLDEN